MKYIKEKSMMKKHKIFKLTLIGSDNTFSNPKNPK